MPDEQQPESPGDGPVDGGDTMTDAEASTGGNTSDSADAKATGKAAATAGKPGSQPAGRPLFSVYGWASAVLGLVSVGALVFGLITWSAHRSDVDERAYRSRVLQTAASWTSVLINLNAENVDKGMQRLHDKTVGPLNSQFDAAVQPYREVVQRIKARSTGRIEAVAIATLHEDFESGESSSSPGGRTDPVTVIATSIAENVGGKPQTVHWALELEVTDIDGRMMISRLRSIR